MPIQTSIILCTYNEVNYLEDTIKNLEKNIPDLEIVIVDDFSTDGTVELIEKLNQTNKFKAVFRKKSRNLASAFVRGLTETTGKYVGWIDTNMGELTAKFPEMINELKLNNDLILMSRYINGGGDNRVFLRAFCSKYFNLLCRLILRTPIKDFFLSFQSAWLGTVAVAFLGAVFTAASYFRIRFSLIVSMAPRSVFIRPSMVGAVAPASRLWCALMSA